MLASKLKNFAECSINGINNSTLQHTDFFSYLIQSVHFCVLQYIVKPTSPPQKKLFSICTKLIQTDVHRCKHGAQSIKPSRKWCIFRKKKKEKPQCPCTYKNKLILLLSSHCQS